MMSNKGKRKSSSGYAWNKKVIKIRPFVNSYLTYEEFYKRCIETGLEEAFYYKNKIIDIYNDGNLVYSTFFDPANSFCEKKTFNSFQEFFETAKFDGNTLKEIWTELK